MRASPPLRTVTLAPVLQGRGSGVAPGCLNPAAAPPAMDVCRAEYLGHISGFTMDVGVALIDDHRLRMHEGLRVAVHACHSGLLPSSLLETLDCWADAPVLGRRSGESYPIRPTSTSSCPRSRKHSSSSYCDWEYIGTWESNLTGSATAWHSRGPGDGRSLYLKSRSDTKGGTLHVKFERTSAWPPNGPRPTADVHPPALTAPPGCQGSGRELFLRSDECTPEYAGTGYGPKTAPGAFSKMQ